MLEEFLEDGLNYNMWVKYLGGDDYIPVLPQIREQSYTSRPNRKDIPKKAQHLHELRLDSIIIEYRLGGFGRYITESLGRRLAASPYESVERRYSQKRARTPAQDSYKGPRKKQHITRRNAIESPSSMTMLSMETRIREVTQDEPACPDTVNPALERVLGIEVENSQRQTQQISKNDRPIETLHIQSEAVDITQGVWTESGPSLQKWKFTRRPRVYKLMLYAGSGSVYLTEALEVEKDIFANQPSSPIYEFRLSSANNSGKNAHILFQQL